MTLLAIVAIHTAANEPPKVRQVMNKIHRNVGDIEVEAATPLGALIGKCINMQVLDVGTQLTVPQGSD